MPIINLCQYNEITVQFFIAEWLELRRNSGIKVTTHEHYRVMLKPLVDKYGSLPMRALTDGMLQDFFDQLVFKDCADSAQQMLSILRPILDTAVREKIILENPTRQVHLSKVDKSMTEKALTPELQQLFLRACQGERLEFLLQFMLRTGVRPGEAVALCWEDVDFDAKKVTVQHSAYREKNSRGVSEVCIGSTKTRRKREFPMSDVLEHILLSQKILLKKAAMPANVYGMRLVFPTSKGTVLEVASINRVLRRIQNKMAKMYAEEYGVPLSDVYIPNFTAHSLRHTFATRALEAGIPLKVVSDWLGHASVRITGDVYSHVLKECTDITIEQLDHYLELLS